MEAREAFKVLILEKIKKLAKVAKAAAKIISVQFILPETTASLMEPLRNKTKGSITAAAIRVLKNNKVSGEMP